MGPSKRNSLSLAAVQLFIEGPQMSAEFSFNSTFGAGRPADGGWELGLETGTASFTNPGRTLTPNATWTIPVTNSFVSSIGGSTSRPRSVNVENLALSPEVQVLSGGQPTSLGVGAQPAQNAPMTAPLVINPASNGGNWFINGTIRFSGLTSLGGSAQGSELSVLRRGGGHRHTRAGERFMTAAGLALVAAVRSGRRRK